MLHVHQSSGERKRQRKRLVTSLLSTRSSSINIRSTRRVRLLSGRLHTTSSTLQASSFHVLQRHSGRQATTTLGLSYVKYVLLTSRLIIAFYSCSTLLADFTAVYRLFSLHRLVLIANEC